MSSDKINELNKKLQKLKKASLDLGKSSIRDVSIMESEVFLLEARIENDQEQLNLLQKMLIEEKLKDEYLSHREILANIDKVNIEICEIKCPFAIEDRIEIVLNNTQSYWGEIKKIIPFYANPLHYLFSEKSPEPKWAVTGKKINKNGLVGKRNFEVNEVFYEVDEKTKRFTRKEFDISYLFK